MSDNPFKQPSQYVNPQGANPNPPAGPRPEKPVLLNICSVLCLILAVVGLLGCLLGVIGLVFEEQMMAWLEQFMPDKEAMENQQALADKQKIPGLFFMIFSLFVSSYLLYSSISCLLDRPAGRRNFVKAVIAAIVLNNLRSVWSVAFQFMNRTEFIEANNTQGTGEMAFNVAIGGTVIVFFLIVGFFILCLFSANTKDAKAYFGD